MDSREYSYGVKCRRVKATDWICTRRPKVNIISFAFNKFIGNIPTMELCFSALADENVSFCLENLAGFTPHWKVFILIRQTLHLYYKEKVLFP